MKKNIRQIVFEIENVLENFVKPLGIKRVFMDYDFVYYTKLKQISFSLLSSKQTEKTFCNFVSAIEPRIKCNIFLLAFCHELGHHFTYFNLTEDTIDYCEDEKDELFEKASLKGLSEKDDYYYYNLPDEIIATRWAINFILLNQKKIKELNNTLSVYFDELKEIDESCIKTMLNYQMKS